MRYGIWKEVGRGEVQSLFPNRADRPRRARPEPTEGTGFPEAAGYNDTLDLTGLSPPPASEFWVTPA